MLKLTTIKEITRYHRRGIKPAEIVARTGFDFGEVAAVVSHLEAEELREAASEMLASPPREYKNRLDEWRLIVEANFGATQ